jgi:AcrR family transcriptional regulator
MGQKGSRTRQDIVEASLQLFSVKGYFNTSISDLLEATGLTKGGLYGHFRSKEEIWVAAYDRAVEIWQGVVFAGVAEIDDPLERVLKTVENDLLGYVGGEVFAGGCFFLNMLVELSGQSEAMSRRILEGFNRFTRLLASWLKEAVELELLAPHVDPTEMADFIVTALNGAAARYAAQREPMILEQTVRQLRLHVAQAPG